MKNDLHIINKYLFVLLYAFISDDSGSFSVDMQYRNVSSLSWYVV